MRHPARISPVVVVVCCVQLEVAFFIDTPTFWQVVTTNVRDCEGLAKEFGSRVMLSWMHVVSSRGSRIIWSLSLGLPDVALVQSG